MAVPRTIAEAVTRAAERFAARTAYIRVSGSGQTRHVAYGEVAARVQSAASGVVGSGLGPRKRIALIGENGPEWAIAYLAIVSAGDAVVPLDSQLGRSELRHVIVASRARALFATEKYLSDALDAVEGLDGLRVVSLGEGAGGVDRFDSFISMATDAPLPAVSPDDLTALLFTSGTTGVSRAVMLTHRNVLSDVEGMLQVFPQFNADDVFLSVLPMHHVYEAACGFVLPFAIGACVAFARSLKSRDLLSDMQTVRPTVMLGVPLLFEKLIEGIERGLRKAPVHRRVLVGASRAVDSVVRRAVGISPSRVLLKGLHAKAGLDRLRVFVSGGAALDPRVSEAYASLGIVLTQGYGLTETSPVIAVCPMERIVHGSVGPPLPNCRIRIAEPGEDGVGEIEVIGPMCTRGYENDPAANEQLITPDGWLRTGDLGRFDSSGFLYIRGRKKSVIVTRAGKNVSPEEVEAHLAHRPSIREAIVMGAPTAGGGEEVVAIVVPDYEYLDALAGKRGRPFTPEELERAVRDDVRAACDGIAPFKRVKRFAIRDEELPKTTTRKVKRYLFTGREVQATSERNGRGGR